MGGLPTGTVTFLFSDIEGSTRLWSEHGTAMREALAVHDRLVRDSVEHCDGHVVKSTGDGTMAVFPSVEPALRAAAAVLLALSAACDDGSLPIALQVRIGIHTGTADERDGDYFGPSVNRAARLMSIGHGNQVLVSQAARSLARGFELLDLGVHRLRDLSEPEHVHQLIVPGLRASFPQLRSLDVARTNLPVQLTSFIGRTEEMAHLTELLRSNRLVTITGVGGVGKTRLALHVGAEVLAHHRDGAWVCELASAEDEAAMPDVIALSLRAPSRPGMSLLDSIIEFLRPRETLLVLDNCEHLLAPVSDLVEVVLQECPGVRVLATSREGLGVVGEQLWPLRSLGTPPRSDVAGDLARSDAVQLFVDRAAAVNPETTLDNVDARAVAEICRRLDGIPLAIELAAARVGALAPAEIAALLDERFRLLTGGRRRSVERHQTLRATVDWSYLLLEPSRRAVFDRLGVFAGSFDAGAAEAVASDADIDRFGVLDALDELVAKSMLVAEHDGGATRYALLETLRQYALEQLGAQGATDAVRRRHARHYAALAGEIGPRLLGTDEVRWRRRLRLELDNLRAAVGWAIELGTEDDRELGLQLLAAIAREVVLDRGSGVGAWAVRAIEATVGSTSQHLPAVLVSASYDAFHHGDLDVADDLAGAAHQLTRDAEEWVAAWAQMARANIAASRGRLEDALALLDDVVTWLPESDVYDRQTAHSIVALYTALTGDLDKAMASARIGLEAAHELGQPSALALAYYANGMVLAEQDAPEARGYCEESMKLTEQGASDVVYANALGTLALVSARLGQVRAGTAFVRRSIAHAYSIGDRPPMVGTLHTAVRLIAPVLDAEVLATIAGGVLDGWFEPMSHIIPERSRISPADLEAAELELGSDRYARARARGASKSYDELVTLVLDQLDAALDALPA